MASARGNDGNVTSAGWQVTRYGTVVPNPIDMEQNYVTVTLCKPVIKFNVHAYQH